MFIFSCGTLEDKNHFEAAGILILLIPILLFLLLIQLIVKDFRSQKWRNVFILIKAPVNQYLTKSDPKLFNWAAKFSAICGCPSVYIGNTGYSSILGGNPFFILNSISSQEFSNVRKNLSNQVKYKNVKSYKKC